jgi:hypothetical protein
VFLKTLGHYLLERDIFWTDAVDGPAAKNSIPVIECKLQLSAEAPVRQSPTHALFDHDAGMVYTLLSRAQRKTYAGLRPGATGQGQ